MSVFILYHLLLYSGVGANAIWLGGSDLIVENEWMWVKTQKPITYTRWSPNEPSHSQSPGDQESCLAFDVGRHFQWDDRRCENRNNFLCESS